MILGSGPRFGGLGCDFREKGAKNVTFRAKSAPKPPPKASPGICAIPRVARLPRAPRATFSCTFSRKSREKLGPGSEIHKNGVSGLSEAGFLPFSPPKRAFPESPLGNHLFSEIGQNRCPGGAGHPKKSVSLGLFSGASQKPPEKGSFLPESVGPKSEPVLGHPEAGTTRRERPGRGHPEIVSQKKIYFYGRFSGPDSCRRKF